MTAMSSQPSQPTLRRYLVISLVFHGLLFGLITWLLLSERAEVREQESLRIADVREVERRRAEEERRAREQDVKDLLSEQAMAEMEQLIAGALEPPDEAQLTEMTEEDVDRQLEAFDEQYSLEELSSDLFYELGDTLRAGTLAQMLANLRQMKRDLLLSQVRAYVRTRVAPEIREKIEQRLKQEVGAVVKDEARRQTAAEQRERLADVANDLQAVIRELGSLKTRQDRVTGSVERRRHADASREEEQIAEAEARVTEKVSSVLEKIERLSPELAGETRVAREPPDEKQVAPAVAAAREAVSKARTAAGAKTAIVQAATRAKTKPDAQQLAEAEKAERDDQAAAKSRSQEAAGRIAGRVAELRDLAGKIDQQMKQAAPDAIQREIAGAASEGIRETVRSEVEKQVKETAIPAAADRIVKALDPELKRRKLDEQEFKEFLEKDIEQALGEELTSPSPEERLALMQVRQYFELDDAKSLEEVRGEVAEVARKLEELAAEQENVRDETTDQTTVRDADREQTLAGDIRKAKAGATEVLRMVRRTTMKNDGPLDRARKELEDTAAEMGALEAARSVAEKAVPEAKEKMTEVAAKLRRSAGAMAQLEKGLAEEAKAARREVPEPVDLAKAMGEERAEAKVAAVEKAVEGVVEKQVKQHVAWAARSVDVTGILDQGNSLARMAELEGRLDQIAANLEEGRELGGLPGAGLVGPGVGLGPGGLPGENLPWTVPGRHAISRFNRRAYEEFIKDMRDRLNPDNYYDGAETAEDIVSRAMEVEDERPAAIVIEELPARKEDDPAKRAVPKPEFPSLAFGAAAMMEKPPKIDGDLADWGELRHGLKMQYKDDSLEKIPDGPTVFVRWSPDGLYIGYTARDTDGIQPCPEQPWSGDCLEFMVDTANSRTTDAYLNPTAQKFCFTPFGCRGSKAVIVWEMGRGLRGMGMARDYPDTEGIKGYSAAKLIPDYGYSVECFLSRRALARPLLVPGQYLAINFCVNQNVGVGTQWSASQQLQTWHRPDTWGDLLLLGSDAKLRFVADDSESPEDARGIVPKESLYLEVADADMNLNTLKVDRVPAEVRLKGGGPSLFVVLGETGVNTGVFRGSVSTQHYFMPVRENTLNVRSGWAVELVYTDARAEFGEQNRTVTTELAVGWPVMRISGQ